MATAVRDRMEELAPDFPSGIAHKVVYDPTTFIDASIDAVVTTLFQALALVVLVVIIFPNLAGFDYPFHCGAGVDHRYFLR